MTLEGKVALVSGASRGIGQAIAAELSRRGAVVIGTATTAAGAEAISAALQPRGGRGWLLDVTQTEAMDAALKAIAAEFGHPVILVNNAGITCDNLLLRMKQHEWDAVLATDLSSVYRLSKAALRGMLKARFGRIINIASVIAATGNAGQSNYAAAKAGMIGFTKSLAQEIGSRGVTVNAVAPGFIDTDMTRALPGDQRVALIERIPLNRLGSALDVAYAVAFLASDEAAYITGQTLHVNGGMYMN